MSDPIYDNPYRATYRLLGLTFILSSGYLQHRGLGHLDAQIVRRNPQVKRIVLEGNDSPTQASAGYHLVASLQLIEHGLPLFLAALLRQNQQEIKNAEDEDQRGDA